jgi:hypothetical protein
MRVGMGEVQAELDMTDFDEAPTENKVFSIREICF